MEVVRQITPSMTQAGTGWRAVLAELGPSIEAESRACDREGRFVSANLDALAEHGFFAMGVPAELGGGGADYEEVAAMLRALGSLCGSTALSLAMHTHQVLVTAWKWRHMGAPVDGLLRRIATEGVRLVSSGASDWLPGSGKAEPTEGGYLVSGRKVFASGSPDGDLLMTGAVFDDPAEGPTVLHFALPLDAPGVSPQHNWDTLGMRGTASQDILIERAFVPEAAISVRRQAGKWHPSYHVVSMLAFPLVYAVYAGVADAIRRDALAIAARKPAEAHTLIMVGELENAHAAMDLAARAMIDAGQGTPSPETTSRVMTLRTLAGKGALDVGSRALDLAGGQGFFRGAGIELRFRDLQAARFHTLQEKPQQVLAGRMALGLPIDG